MSIFSKKPDVGKMIEAKDVQGLIEALRSKNASVRVKAAKGLGAIKDTSAVDPLIQVLKDLDETVRHEAALALGEIQDVRAIEPLTSLLKSGYLFDQLNAGIALENITGKKTLFKLDLKK